MIKVYSPQGVEVLLPLEKPVDFAQVRRRVEEALAAGFLAHRPEPVAPGEGEKTEPVGFVVRKTKDSTRPGQPPSDLIDLYSTNPQVKFPLLSVYLNTDEERAAFERASGLKPEALPEYEGESKIERGKGPKTDKYVVPAARPFSVVMTPNPKYSEEEAQAAKLANKAYPVPKRKFVRWC